MKKEKIIFMGTPPIARTMLERLTEADYDVVLVVTQPDCKSGRKQLLTMSAVKEYALSKGLALFQPEDIKSDHAKIMETDADLIVTCAYGQFVPEQVLTHPRFGAVNLHASLLPKLRGGAPVHKAIINGDAETGMSMMRMVRRMDAGAVMAQCHVPISETDTAGTLFDKLAVAGGDLLIEQLPSLFDGSAVFVEQDESQATFAYTITPQEERIDLSRPLSQVYDQARGLIPFPIGHVLHEGKKVKLHQVRKKAADHDLPAGTCAGLIDDGFAIAVEGGYLLVDEIQLEGKKRTDARSFYNGVGKQWLHTRFDR